MGDLPSGTVTFLFTDIEGSTRLLQELGDAYAGVLAEHRRQLREAFARHSGVEVDTQGDAFFVAFSRASDAVAAARDGQAALAAGPVRVRVGIHTGEPLVTDEGYVGVDVHRAARIAAIGHGGQVLLSQAARDLVDENLRDLGAHRLKDLAEPLRLFQLGADEFPPLRSLYRTNLPTVRTPFVGRRPELDQIGDLLERPDVRLLTLTGVGGSGKTRLALAAAAEASDRYPDGVWWVGLAALRDSRLVVPTIAAALETEEEPSGHIGDRRMLLLLDNFEQVIDAAGEVGALLDACSNLEAVVTSREPLHLSRERVVAVLPLVEADAVELFRERVVAIGSDVQPRSEEVFEVCRKVDGLPLAVELAASRTIVLSTSAILEQLDARLSFLAGGPRDAPQRQQTLRATIGWSYDLLPAQEARLFARLGVFAGGCTLDEARVVCGAQVDAIASLVEKSLVRRRDDRYWMLETIREYALEKLHEQEEEFDTASRALADYMAARGEEARRLLEGLGALPDARARGALIRKLGEQLDNVRAAVTWALERSHHELALRLASEAHWFANGLGTFVPEQARWLDEAMQMPGDASARVHLRALESAVSSAWRLEQYEKVRALGDELVRLARDLADTEKLIEVLAGFGMVTSSAAGDDILLARAHLEEALELAEQTNSRWMYHPLHGLGELELRWGNADRATELLERSAQLARNAGAFAELPAVLHGCGDAALALGNQSRAAERYTKSLRLAQDVADWFLATGCVAGLAATAAIIGDTERAGRLWGGLQTIKRDLGWTILSSDIDLYDTAIAIRSQSDPIAFAAATERGRRMSPGEIVAYALGDSFSAVQP